MIDQLSILLTHPLWHTKNTLLVAQDKVVDIASDKFIEAFDLLKDCASTLRKFESDTGTILSCPLLQADNLKHAKPKLDYPPKCFPDHHLTITPSMLSPLPLHPQQMTSLAASSSQVGLMR